ncbi:hypothetical protein ABFT23_19055 [Nocardioides sp. C4-1]|uniref:hypothetical protein n=1 Tax=Nocardioides sp. C4-1 TaxID=3151851 RepID=UPI0032678253
MKRLTMLVVAAVLTTSLAACSDDPPPVDDGRTVLAPGDGTPHSHTTFVGDGTTADAGGYRLTDLRFPTVARAPADLSFRIVDSSGEPVVDYAEEQTKLLHLYVVRDDLADFRHLHPTLGPDGTWTARVDLTDPGQYRVIAEFLPVDEERNPDGDHVILGQRALLAGEAPAVPEAPSRVATDGLVTIEAPETLPAGEDTQFDFTVSDGAGGVLNLGTYLGSYAHVTGFDTATGAFVHAHPLGAPTVTDAGSELTFHTALGTPGTYRFFVQVRVDGFVHTVPLQTTVA